jgi:hypothetical protein
MWARISNSATTMACAACLAVAATLPWAGSAAERVATEDMRLAAITDIDAFSAIPLYFDLLFGDAADRAAAVAGLDSINGIPGLLAFLGGDPNQLLANDDAGIPGYDALSAIDVFFGNASNDGADTGGVFNGGGIDALADYDALSAIPVFFGTNGVFNGGGIDALADYDALSAIPVFRDVAVAAAAGNLTGDNSVASALGGYDALSALDTFFGDGPDGEGSVFVNDTGGIRIDALAPNADGTGGYAALSALPVFFGTADGNFGAGVFSPGGGIGSLRNYDALSGIPEYLNAPPNLKNPDPAPLAATPPAPELKVAQTDPAPTTTPSAGTNRVQTFVATLPKPSFTPPAPQALTPPAPPKVDLKPDTSGDDVTNEQNVQRTSDNFSTRKKVGDDPFLYGSGNKGPDSGIRGWGSMLKKAGLGGGEEGGEGAN